MKNKQNEKMKTTTKTNGTNKSKNEKTNLNNIPKFNLKPGILFLILINLLIVNAAASDGMMCGTVNDLEKLFKTNATPPDDNVCAIRPPRRPGLPT